MARITWPELRSAILLLSMTLLVLPLVPSMPLPWLAGVNPHKVWLLAILLAGISFLGYLAVKLGGAGKGLLLAGAAGGLVSSTAVTVGNAHAAARGGPAGALAAGALVAGAVSCLRTVVLALIASPETGRVLGPALVAAAAAMGGAAAVLAWRGTRTAPESALPENPFEIQAVLRLALLLAAVAALAGLGAAWLGEGAVVAIAAVTGLADVDAITLSVPQLAPAVISTTTAATAVAVAVACNIVAKVVYAVALGTRRYALPFGLGSLAGLAVGGALLLALG